MIVARCANAFLSLSRSAYLERSAAGIGRPFRWTRGSRNVLFQALDRPLVAAAQLDHMAVGIADEDRHAVALAKLDRSVGDRDVVALERGNGRGDRADTQRDVGE